MSAAIEQRLTAERLREALLYAPGKGVFYWIAPSAGHSDLLGEEAGSPANFNGKVYHVIQLDGRKYKRSRLAFLYMTGRFPPDLMDHINGVSTDDRWINLRPATIAENARNHKGRRKLSDLPMGVRRNSTGRFAARIGFEGRQIQIGTFDTAEDARAAYLLSREKYFGQFA